MAIVALAGALFYIHPQFLSPISKYFPRLSSGPTQAANDLSLPLQQAKTSGYEIKQLPDVDYYRSDMMLRDFRPDQVKVDANGIRVYPVGDQDQYRPVTIAQYALRQLAQYREGTNAQGLDQALRNARWLRQHAQVDKHGRMWFPYQDDYPLSGNAANVIHAPWYSAMAQGQVLSLFVRLEQTTGQAQWRQAAGQVFATFTTLRGQDQPWIVLVDNDRHLWLEEYAGDTDPLRVINGQGFALFGLLDYYRLHPGKETKTLIDAALTSLVQTFAIYRQVGQGSLYCVEPRWCLEHHTTKYHEIAIQQFDVFGHVTGDKQFLEMANTLRSDFRYYRDGKLWVGW